MINNLGLSLHQAGKVTSDTSSLFCLLPKSKPLKKEIFYVKVSKILNFASFMVLVLNYFKSYGQKVHSIKISDDYVFSTLNLILLTLNL